ncbi:MAG TPA: hypothetical protein VJZ03_07005 [Candidatus Bathyarchaeia archaeon]|nr:hypothetical protein [Candidatus Bathyarchaeia archaeon]
MSFVPRMRGKRFLRPASKKAKRSKEPTPSYVYTSKDKDDSIQIATNILNAVDHLGKQRFALPPFSEHLQRWFTDLQSLVNEFKDRIPEAVDTQFQTEIQEILLNLRGSFSKQTEIEMSASEEQTKLQPELTRLELELSKLEKTYRSKLHEIRLNHDKSNQKLRGEIASLDLKRLQILRKKPTIIQRIMRKSKSGLEGASAELESKRTKLSNGHQTFEQVLLDHRNEYAKDRQKLLTSIDSLRQKIEAYKETVEDDALEIRTQACLQIHSAIDRAMMKIASREPETQPPSHD